jgi:hypothetical protein
MGILDLLIGKKERRPVVRVATSRKASVKAIRPDNTPLHVKRGWAKKGNTHHGYYRTKHGAWRGKIERRGDKFRVLIQNPPKEKMKKHSRRACFHAVKGGWWRIDLAVNPKDGDVGSIIFYVEKVINESFSL